MYGISTNNGYGTAAHLKGIATHGITQFHRKTFGACREAKLSQIRLTYREISLYSLDLLTLHNYET